MQINVMLTGSFGVGKSSLFNRFIFDEFEEAYHDTIGVRINHKKILHKGKKIEIRLWDIAGEVLQSKVPLNYFADKDVILYLVDLNRPFTLKNAGPDLRFLKAIAKPDTIIKFIGSKRDLINHLELEELENRILPLKIDLVISSKTGENIELLFRDIGNLIIE